MPFCHKCGFKLDPDDKFCFKCGTPVRESKQNKEIPPKADIDDIISKSVKIEEQKTARAIKNDIVEKPESSVDISEREETDEPSESPKKSKINRTPLVITLVLLGIFLHICLIVGIGMSSTKREVIDKNANSEQFERDAGGNNNWFWKPSPTPSPSPTPKPVIKVSTKQSTLSDSTKWGYWKLEYPQISISGRNTDSVNSKIDSDFQKYKYNWKDDNSKPYNSSFKYFIDDEVISILVEIKHDSKYYQYLDYVVYNISIQTGELLSDSEVVKRFGIKDNDFFFLVKKTYNRFEAGISWVNQTIKDKCTKANLERISYQYVKPYINVNGDLCFVGYVDHAGKLEKGNLCFNTSLCSCINKVDY